MKILKRILIVLLGLILLLVISGYVYLQTTKPEYEGEKSFTGISQEVDIRFDPYGIPHIYAQNAEDAYFALGYVHAQDRLFQMEMLRRAAGGRLSEILGKDLLPVDKLFRTLGVNVFAKEHAQKYLSADTAKYQKAAHAYQKGINEFIRSGPTPLEFSIIGIPKTEFTPEDIYLALGFMSFGFAEGIKADPVLEKIKTEWGENYLKDLAVQSPDNAVRIKSFQGPAKKLVTDPLIAALHQALENIPVPLWSGSNGWVISGSRTKSGLPILANDTHIGFSQPAVWYEAHLEYPGTRFYGHYLAGIPFGFLGNNDFCGWGLTMFENDDTDFFRETANPQNANQVKFIDQWEDLQIRKEPIHIKNEPDVILEVKSSRHGPIINGIMEEIVPPSSPVSLWWAVNHQSNQALQAAYELNHASSLEDAQHAARLFSAPGLNVMYGDRAGNIAWWAVAKLPIRGSHVNSKLFLDGASGKDEFQGYYDFSKNPQAINPPWGFVYSANNQPDTVNGVSYPGYYYPRSRSGRIVELISEDKLWTTEDIKKVNLDVVSKMHPVIAKLFADVLGSMDDSRYKDIVGILRNWDGDHGTKDIAPSIYYNLLSQTMVRTLADELGWDAYDAIMATSIPKNSYDILIGNEQSPWWDDVSTTNKKESRYDMISQAANKAIDLLSHIAGKEVNDWEWGKIHTLTHAHALGSVKPLDKFFSVGPFTVPGGSEVINNLHFELDTTGYFPANGGPALRKITDFADLENGESISPTGQSGNVMSPNYSDQAEMFATGKFRKMMMNKEEIRQASQSLLLKPKGSN